MSRPQPQILNTINATDFIAIDVLKTEHLYTVLYQGQSINIRKRCWRAQGETIKYLKTTYANLASAENLAKKLNKAFRCLDFTVKEVE